MENQTEKTKSSRDPIMSVAKRNRDLEKRTQRALGANIILSLALAVSVGGNVLQGTRHIESHYFVQNSDGSGMIPITPLSQPMSSKGAVSQLVVDAISNLNSLDFANYKQQLGAASPYFTRTGWDRYMDEFVASGTRDVIEKRQLVMSGAVTKPPVIIGDGELYGAKFWDVEVPYMVRYQGAGYDQQQSGIARVKVIRVPVTENPKGIAIAQFAGKAG